MNIDVLITNYRAWNLTQKAIHEVLRWSGDEISRMIVIDDDSDAPDHFPDSDKVTIQRNSKNVGLVRSLNLGMRLTTAEVVLLLDCDAYPLMNLIPGILKHFTEDSHLGALGFFELRPNGRTRIAGGNEPTLAHFLLGRLGGRFARRGWFLGKRFVLHACCMAVRRSAFEQIGGFDEEFDWLDFDADFSMRLLDAGWLIEADAALKCFHQGSGSPQATSRRVMRFHRNRWLLLKKHDKVPFITICRLILILRHYSEWALLQLSGALRLRTQNELDDKLAGRRYLIRSVFH
ncbi:MAG: glycosyltransferase family 2 protein, partial [Verrucomicrobiota bacterium]